MTFNEAFRWLRDRHVDTWQATAWLADARDNGSTVRFPLGSVTMLLTFSRNTHFMIRQEKAE